jgi:hypothetical protein
MKLSNFTKTAGAGVVFASVILMGMLISSTAGRGQVDNSGAVDEQLMITQGFAIAPVPLNLSGKDHDLVGLGSYLVNAVADCNGCHNSSPQDNEFTATGNPYLLTLQAGGPFTGNKQVNPATYLAGGQNFGTLDPNGLSAPIITRNLTPDYAGNPEGGHSYNDFVSIMTTGVDLDGIHPTCTGALNQGCVPFPFNGKLLQIMPWPAFQSMTSRQIQAIFEYLSAIPCIDNSTSTPPPGFPDELRNNCGSGRVR